jgi:pimeloyl-ACP methyl ester carboxylesterase
MSRFESLGDGKEATLAQGRLRYRERGEGEPIVFVHGLLVNGDLWRNVVPRLADR